MRVRKCGAAIPGRFKERTMYTRQTEKTMQVLVLSSILILSTLCHVSAADGQILTNEQWLEDLEFVTSRLKSHHPNPHYKIDEV